MDTFRKWLNKPKADDKSLLARFYHADRSLTAVASELDSFDGRAEPDRCSRLVSRLRQGQDKVLAITNLIMEELLGEDRDPRAFRAKFPEEVLQENLAGQLWFGAECLAAGSSIMNREQESKEMRPLAQAVTKSLGNVRNLLRDQCLRNNVPNSKTLHLDINDSTTEQLYESLKIFDRLFAEFELRYVSAMVQVKTKHEYEMQELICVLFSETLQRALKIGLLEQEKVDAFDPALMFSIPRLAIIAGLVVYPKGPLNMDMSAEQLSEMFRPFRTILIKIRELLRTLSRNELLQLERLLCTNEDIQLQVGTSSIEAPVSVAVAVTATATATVVDQENNNKSSSSDSKHCDNDDNRDVHGNEDNSSQIQTATEQRNNNNISSNSQNANANTNANTNRSITAAAVRCAKLRRLQLTRRFATTSPTNNYAARSPSISSISADSSPASTPIGTPSPSPTPSPSIASTSSVDSSSSTSPFIRDFHDWSDDEYEDYIGEVDDDALPKELDIVSADCASGYLIPNTNFGNLLQPQQLPLTENFIASENELGAQHDHLDEDNDVENNAATDADVPTTSAAVLATLNESLRRLRDNDSSEDSERLTMKALTADTAAASSNQDSSSASSSRNGKKNDAANNSHVSHHHHHNQQHKKHHRHHHHHHHHHHHNCSRSQHSKTKRCSLESESESCQATAEAASTKGTTTTQTDSTATSASTATVSAAQTLNTVQHDTSSVDSSTSSSHFSDGDQHEVSLALRAAGRMKFKSTENLLHRLFVCIAGVADQLQTNFASDLRHILRSVFLMNMSPAQEELDIPEKPKESELFEFRASENDVIQQSGGSNQSIYSAEEVNPETDNVFNNNHNNNNNNNNNSNSNSSGNIHSSSSNSSSSSGGMRHSTGTSIPRVNTIDLGGTATNANSNATETTHTRNSVARSRSLGDQENNVTSANQRLTTYMSGQRQRQLGAQRNRNNSVGSNSPTSSSSSSESNSPISERVAAAAAGYGMRQNNSNNADGAQATIQTTPPPVNTRLAPPAWIPDDKAPRCMDCETAFTAFRRRHHCRNCGGVFCSVCSNATVPLPKYGLTKAVRVCRRCYLTEVYANMQLVDY